MTSFVTLDPTGNLMLDGRRFRFCGANMPFIGERVDGDSKYGAPVDSFGQHVPTHSEIDATLAEAVAMKHNVLQIYPPSASGSQTSLAVYSDASLEPIDYLLSRCATLDIRLICGSFASQYRPSDFKLNRPDLESKFFWCSINDVTPDSVAHQFFDLSQTKIQTSFKNYVAFILNHVNTYTGVKYKDDPTILAWVPVPEASFWGSGPSWTDQAVDWMDDIAYYIKTVCGAKQLVVDGHCSPIHDDGTPYIKELSSPNVDIMQAHPYGPMTAQALNSAGRLAHSYGKAFILGEWPWNGQNVSFPWNYDVLSYTTICPLFENSPNLDGTAYWQLLAPLHNWGGTPQPWTGTNYTLHYPGDYPLMTSAVKRLTEHSVFMASGLIGKATGPAFLVDSFTDADNVLLENHVGELGATWTKAGGQAGSMTVKSGGVYASSGDASYKASATSPSPDYQVIGTVRIMSAAGSAWVTGRMSGQNGYMALLYYYQPPWWAFWQSPAWVLILRQYINGVATDLGAVNPSATVGQEYDLGLIMKGNQISVTWDGVITVLGPVTNSSITAAGSVGIGGNFMSPTTGYHIRTIEASPV